MMIVYIVQTHHCAPFCTRGAPCASPTNYYYKHYVSYTNNKKTLLFFSFVARSGIGSEAITAT